MSQNEEITKELTVEYLEELNETQQEMFELVVNGVSLKINIVFEKTKIRDLIQEAIQNLHANRMSEAQIQNMLFPYIRLLMIKYFTSLQMSNDIDEQLEIMKILINNDLLVPILDAMREEEVNKVWAEFKDILVKINEFVDQFDEEYDKLDIKNVDEMLAFIERK